MSSKSFRFAFSFLFILLIAGTSNATSYDYTARGITTSVNDPGGVLYNLAGTYNFILNVEFNFDTNNVYIPGTNGDINMYTATFKFNDNLPNTSSGYLQDSGLVSTDRNNSLTGCSIINIDSEYAFNLDNANMTWRYESGGLNGFWQINGDITSCEQVSPVPEPSSIILLVVGCGLFAAWHRRASWL